MYIRVERDFDFLFYFLFCLIRIYYIGVLRVPIVYYERSYILIWKVNFIP